MSKKLLMNNYCEPVMDGLICWLDGRDGNNNDVVWKDRSDHNNDGILHNFNSSAFENGYLVSKNFVNYVELFKNIPINDKTFIINTKIDSNNTINLLMGGWEYHIRGKQCFSIMNRYPHISQCSLIWTNAGIGPTVLSSFSFLSEYTNIAITIANKQVKTFINGQLKATSKLTQELIIDNFYLLRKDDELRSCCRATIGSFMTYNRALTEKEIRQNYLYEQSIKRS